MSSRNGSGGRRLVDRKEYSTHNSIFGGAGHNENAAGRNRNDSPNTRKKSREETNNDVSKTRKLSGRRAPDGVPRLRLGSVTDDGDSNAKNRDQNYNTCVEIITTQSPVPIAKVSSLSPTHQRKRSGELSSGRPKKHDFIPVLQLDLSASSDALQAMKDAANDIYRDVAIECPDVHNNSHFEDQTNLGMQRKQQVIEEALLADEMSRLDIDDQTSNQISRLNNSQQSQKKHKRRSLLTNGDDLINRLRFGARIITRSDRDALREISAFFFAADSSITMYEFRQFGTRSSALPFIARDAYCHISGRRADQPFCILDIAVGNILTFDTINQTTLPVGLRQDPLIRFIITDLDMSSKEDLKYNGCHTRKERMLREEWMDNYFVKDEQQLQEILRNVQRRVQMNLLKRVAVKTLIGIRKHLVTLDKSGKGFVTKEQMMTALRKFRIDLSNEEFHVVLLSIGDGVVPSSVGINLFLYFLVGTMKEESKIFVRRAFLKMDHAKTGVIRVTELPRFYYSNNHPSVVSGKKTESDVRKTLLASFADTQISGEIKYVEFEDYCEALNLTFDKEERFQSFMRRMWGI